MTNETMSPLRRRMIEDMTIRNFGPKTHHDYIRSVRSLTVFLGRSPDTASNEDVRRFQLRLSSDGISVRGQHEQHRFRTAVFLPCDAWPGRYREPSAVRPPAPQASRRSEPGGGLAFPGGGAGAQVQGGVQRGLWRWLARVRGDVAQAHGHRQQAHGHPCGAGQGPQGSLRDAVATTARTVARLVARGAAGGLAVSGSRSRATAHDTPAQSRLPRRGSDG